MWRWKAMIKIVKGDLLLGKEDIIAHSVNCMGKMNSGVAKQIREKYPVVFKSYQDYIYPFEVGEDIREHLLGEVQGVLVDSNRKIIVNMFGQHRYGYDGKQYTNTEALFKCFKKVRRLAEKEELSVAMPYRIASHRGGADWTEVEDLILTAFNGYSVTLYKL